MSDEQPIIPDQQPPITPTPPQPPEPPAPLTENLFAPDRDPYNIVVNVPKSNNRVQNWVSIIGVLISLGLAVVTYCLYTRTIEANQTALAANVLSERSIDSAAISNRNNLATQRELAESSNKSTKKALDIAQQNSNSSAALATASQKSLAVQINAITKAQERFLLENEAYLEITTPEVHKNIVGKPIDWTDSVENLGNMTVEGDSAFTGAVVIKKYEYKDFIKAPFKFIRKPEFVNNKKYYSKGSPTKFESNTEKKYPTSTDTLDDIIYGRSVLFMYGQIRYTSTVNGRKRVYSYVIEILKSNEKETPFPGIGYIFIYDKNEYIQ